MSSIARSCLMNLGGLEPDSIVCDMVPDTYLLYNYLTDRYCLYVFDIHVVVQWLKFNNNEGFRYFL